MYVITNVEKESNSCPHSICLSLHKIPTIKAYDFALQHQAKSHNSSFDAASFQYPHCVFHSVSIFTPFPLHIGDQKPAAFKRVLGL